MSQKQHIEEIKTTLRRAGLTDNQIGSYLLDLDARLQASLIDECLDELNPSEKEEFEKLVASGATLQELVSFLKLDKKRLEDKIALKFEQFKTEIVKQF